MPVKITKPNGYTNGKSVHLTSKQLVKIREYLLLVMTNQ